MWTHEAAWTGRFSRTIRALKSIPAIAMIAFAGVMLSSGPASAAVSSLDGETAAASSVTSALSMLVVPLLLLSLPLLMARMLILSGGARLACWRSFIPCLLSSMIAIYVVSVLAWLGLPLNLDNEWANLGVAGLILFLIGYGLDSLLLIATQWKTATDRIALSTLIGNGLTTASVVGVTIGLGYISADMRDTVTSFGSMLTLPLLELPPANLLFAMR